MKCASTCANQTSGSAGQKAGSFRFTAEMSPEGGGALMEMEVEGSNWSETEEVSNSGRSLSVDIMQKAPQGVGVTNVADSKPLISRIVQTKSIFNFYTKIPCG